MDLIQAVVALIVALGILVTFHEFGHFWVARKCGIKVLRFSVGFGQPLVKWYDKQGTEFAIAWIPLGGYVKFLDEREAPVEPELQHQEFTRKPVWQRMAVVAAGPIANLLLAVLIYWGLYLYGVPDYKSFVGPTSGPAAEQGIVEKDQVVAVNGKSVATWESLHLALAGHIGSRQDLVLELQNGDLRRQVTFSFDEPWLGGIKDPNPIEALGLTPYRPHYSNEVDTVSEGGPAAKAGMQPGDRIVAINGVETAHFEEVVRQIVADAKAKEALQVQVERLGQRLDLAMVPEYIDGRFLIGVTSTGPLEDINDYRVTHRFGVVEAMQKASEKTWDSIGMMLTLAGRMFSGAMTLENLSGPVSIAKVAGEAVSIGPDFFISLLAMLSISLGILNLLPIPVLDGGHLLYYFIEAVRGKPLSLKVQEIGFRIGMAMLFTLMVIALVNDIGRL